LHAVRIGRLYKVIGGILILVLTTAEEAEASRCALEKLFGLDSAGHGQRHLQNATAP